jgi:ABC-type amino acid transport substrate-binding protein
MRSLFLDDLNTKLAKDNKLKQKHLKVRAVFIPVERGKLLQALIAGKGDIVISSLGVTEERRKLVDFSSPLLTDVSELVVSGAGSPTISGRRRRRWRTRT